jgi:hypothetical protein
MRPFLMTLTSSGRKTLPSSCMDNEHRQETFVFQPPVAGVKLAVVWINKMVKK